MMLLELSSCFGYVSLTYGNARRPRWGTNILELHLCNAQNATRKKSIRAWDFKWGGTVLLSIHWEFSYWVFAENLIIALGFTSFSILNLNSNNVHDLSLTIKIVCWNQTYAPDFRSVPNVFLWNIGFCKVGILDLFI